MSNIANTIDRYVAVAPQSALGTPALTTATDARKSRRKSFTIGFKKNTFESGEKTTDGQEHDIGHGQFMVAGDINGELYSAEWQREFEAICRRDMTALGATTAATGDGITLVGSTGVLTRVGGSGGSFIVDGHRVGHVVSLGAIATALDIAKPATIVALTATAMTLDRLDGKLFTDISVADENATVNGIGMGTYIPATGRTDPVATIEDHHADLDISALYKDVRLSKMSLKIAPNGFADITFSYVGTGDNDDLTGVSAPYFTSPVEPGLYRGLTGIRAAIRIAGQRIRLGTNMTVEIDLQCVAPEVIASQISPDVFYGKNAKVSGELTAYINSNVLRDAFRNEAIVPVAISLYSPDQTQGIAIYCGRTKLNTNDKDDPENGIQQTASFRALRPDPATGTIDSVVLIQDFSAS